MVRFLDSSKENDYNRINTSSNDIGNNNDEDYSSPISGYLLKRATNGEWQKRFFEINGNYLIYYKNSSMSKLLAAVSIPQLGNIKITGEIQDNKGKGCIFQIDLKDRQYQLRSETVEDSENWVKHLIFIRDGELNPMELKLALKASPTNYMKMNGNETGNRNSRRYTPGFMIPGMSSDSTTLMGSSNSTFNPIGSDKRKTVPPPPYIAPEGFIETRKGIDGTKPAESCSSFGSNPAGPGATGASAYGFSSYLQSPASSVGDFGDPNIIKANKELERFAARRQSDTTWQKPHRSFLCCFFG
jgi:hypothetical protein